MVDLKAFPIFANHLSNLKETSRYKKEDGTSQYMTQSTREAVDFDDVKDEYVESLGLSEPPKSNDALFDDGNGFLVFVEFKSGRMNHREQFAVRKKVYDSTLIFTDITSKRISYMRDHMKYIFVYNETVNQNNDLGEDLKKKRETAVQPSPAFDAFAKNMGKYAKEEYVLFGLKIFQNYCFKEVHTYTEAEFNAYLSTL